ncbi:MAG: NAD(P)H-dependent glycerol-3-phosphate dehydrogenase [Bacilli bacterium]
MKITLLGTGAYGLAIASKLASNNFNVCMWTENKEKEEEYQKTHNLKSINSNYEMPDNIEVTSNIKDAMTNAKIIFFTCASKYVSDMSALILPYFNKDMIICIASKGIDEKTCNLLSNVVKFILNSKNITVISGPTFAVDMLNNEPVALAIAGTNKKSLNEVISVLSGKTIKLRKSKDLIGIQICGSIKNIIAIASGILGGLGYSESTRAFLINESLHDIKNLIHYMGGKKKTILSFAGIGDLLMTCMSTKSRNYSFGFVIGKTKDKKEMEKYLENNTVEGLNTLKTVLILLKRKNINIPLINIINDIVNFKKEPESLAEFLINKK